MPMFGSDCSKEGSGDIVGDVLMCDNIGTV